MMKAECIRRAGFALLILLTASPIGHPARAQENGIAERPAAPSVRHREPRRTRAPDRVAAVPRTEPFRGLTINRESNPLPETDRSISDFGFGGGARSASYGSIDDFDPTPSVTSGLQYPYGLDGIGGYGDDLGFGSGQSSAYYQRRP